MRNWAPGRGRASLPFSGHPDSFFLNILTVFVLIVLIFYSFLFYFRLF